MTLRCNCSDHGDDLVFGPCYKCSPKADTKPYTPRTRIEDLPPLVPSWRFVVPPEQPFERVLSDDVEPGDLG